MAALVAYTLELPAAEPQRPDLVEQLAASLRTLRSHSREIPVALFLYGGRSRALDRLLGEHRVLVHEQGSYERRLAQLCPAGWSALARYPLLCKYLNFAVLSALDARQVLLCDCDTLFFADVAPLLERYAWADLVAREEVHSSRSPYGEDRSFIDEPLLARLAAADGATAVPPFNTGVVLLSHPLVRWLAAHEALVVDYAWRFLLWMALHPASGEEALYGELDATGRARALVADAYVSRALPFPSTNRWLLDEVSFWLALGHVPGPRIADFDRADVVQNGEYSGSSPQRASWTICHYYSQNQPRVAAWLRGEEEAVPA
jgi:hypothetical protein